MVTSPLPFTIGSLNVIEREVEVWTPTASSAGVVNVMKGFSSSSSSVTGYFGGTTLVEGQYPSPGANIKMSTIDPFSSMIASAWAPPPCLVLSIIAILGVPV